MTSEVALLVGRPRRLGREVLGERLLDVPGLEATAQGAAVRDAQGAGHEAKRIQAVHTPEFRHRLAIDEYGPLRRAIRAVRRCQVLDDVPRQSGIAQGVRLED